MKLFWLNYGLGALTFLFVVFTVGIYITYAADNVSKYTNYFVSVGALPFVYGAFIGYLTTLIMPEESFFSEFNRVVIILGVGLVALLPTILVLVGMLLPHNTQ